MTTLTEGATVSPLELFFDLVFVFAITQVVLLMAHGSDGQPTLYVVRGLLVLAILWWCWCCYAWLGNTVRADDGAARLALFVVMGIMFVVALTIPEAFDDMQGGVGGPLVFAACYLLVRTIHLILYWIAAAGDEGLRTRLLKNCIPMLGGAIILAVAAFTEGWVQVLLWGLALAFDYTCVLLLGLSGWRINSAKHWTERHGLVIIIALGESIMSIGVGVAEKPISWPVILGAALGIIVAAAMWWAYFDTMALAAEHAMARARGQHRVEMAAHGYTYLHLPLVAGIVLVALGMKKVLTYVADPAEYGVGEHLHAMDLFALVGGVVLYLLGHAAFGWRTLHTVKVQRLIAAGALLLLAPVAARVPALAALGIVALVLVLTFVYETIRYAEAREAVRHGDGTGHPEHTPRDQESPTP
jgi:low temperature requirement protein LtrA